MTLLANNSLGQEIMIISHNELLTQNDYNGGEWNENVKYKNIEMYVD